MTPGELAAEVARGDRRALARAITLVESARADDQERAAHLLEHLLPKTGNAMRVGISGPPGVGKSTLIEALGCWLVDRGEKVAVLAIDPSSPTTGGSLLGDKTRMERLQPREQAFIRPSPSAGMLGGTAPHSRDALLLCEAAGYSVVLVETVGVGQSEIAIADLVDTVVLLLPPGGGDELQGSKRGLLERTDVIAVNKADGERAQDAARTRADYEAASRLFMQSVPGFQVPVLTVSALEGGGLDVLWSAVQSHRQALVSAGMLESRRAAQAERALWRAVEEALVAQLRAHPDVRAALPKALDEVRAGRKSAAAAARALLAALAAPTAGPHS
ncbi:MAG: methylmalonyl Co-A mutase-associated GTPase MeaB [Deltaproteobacteria bacterium]|nr:methylmalonyl Co-A mutase-associated GTPase MeaB [Deltaproteobacteria bacterium]